MAPRAQSTSPIRSGVRVECFALGEIGEKRETWVQVAKVGEWFRDGRKVSLATSDLESMVTKFAARKNDLVLDYEHATENPYAGKAPAAGWVKELEVRADGTELWARVKFTRTGAEHVREEEYRFTSPVFQKNAEDRETGDRGGCELCSVGLVNDAFLDGMQPVALSRRERMAADSAAETMTMDEATMAKLLELTGAADAAALLAWVEAKASEAMSETKPPPADEEAEKMKRTLGARDAELEILRARVAVFETAKGETDEERAERAVTDAIKAKRATETERAALKRLFVADPDAFAALTKRAVVPTLQTKGAESAPRVTTIEAPAMFVEAMKAAGVTDSKTVAAAWAKNGPAARKSEV